MKEVDVRRIRVSRGDEYCTSASEVGGGWGFREGENFETKKAQKSVKRMSWKGYMPRKHQSKQARGKRRTIGETKSGVFRMDNRT